MFGVEHIVSVFLETVEQLVTYKMPSGGRLYIESNQNEYLNFKPKNFRLALSKSIGGEIKVNDYLKLFKKLGFIHADKDRFTCIRKFRKKPIRVIAVKKSIYETYKELKRHED